jgi:hypothetical protein
MRAMWKGRATILALGAKRVILLAIDPGPEESAYVVYDTERKIPTRWAKVLNLELDEFDAEMMAIEMIASYGMAVGREVFETCVWIGRFIERWQWADERFETEPELVYRRNVKLHLCDSPRANDSNIVHALYDRYGGSRRAAVGVKASPGPLYGMSKDCWQALAVAITAAEVSLPSRMESLLA